MQNLNGKVIEKYLNIKITIVNILQIALRVQWSALSLLLS